MTFLDILTTFFINHESFDPMFGMYRCTNTRKMPALSSVRNVLFRHDEKSKITFPQNVTCPYKQLFFPYPSIFFKNDNCRVYSVLCGMGKIVLVTLPRWPSCPYMVIVFGTNWLILLKLGIQHQAVENYQVVKMMTLG